MTNNSVFCKNCGATITNDLSCPQCGSMARAYHLDLLPPQYSFTVQNLTAIVITYPEALLAKAQELIAKGEFSIAVVVAHMACEISVERAISRAFLTKGIQYLEGFIEGLSLGYNLANPRILKLYNAVTGDEIKKQAFWQAFKESATRRNQAVHKGRIITEADAKASFQAASDLVAYLK